jgi:hypothetical protein
MICVCWCWMEERAKKVLQRYAVYFIIFGRPRAGKIYVWLADSGGERKRVGEKYPVLG